MKYFKGFSRDGVDKEVLLMDRQTGWLKDKKGQSYNPVSYLSQAINSLHGRNIYQW